MLEVLSLRKTYGPLEAVTDLSFHLEPGDVFGFIGSNGAGKTTTIRMLATLLEPTSGTARINGWDIMREPMKVRSVIGYMPDFFGLYDDIRVWEYLEFWATVYRIQPREQSQVIGQVLELTNLSAKRDAFVQSLSRGMQQRLCLAKCLVHDPDLLLLDEPASGLDPRARAELKELILELGRMGKIVIVSSHILPELADFCNMVGIIEQGDMIAWGPVKEIVTGFHAHRQIVVRTLGDPEGFGVWLQEQKGVHQLRWESDGLHFDFAGDDHDQAGLLRAAIQAGFDVVSCQERAADLEDVFLRLTTGAVI